MKTSGLIEKIAKIIVEKYSPIKVIVFGSHAWGKPTKDSDIDFLIVKETGKTQRRRFTEVQKLLHGFHGTTPVEPLVLTPKEVEKRIKLEDPFILKILKEGRKVYG